MYYITFSTHLQQENTSKERYIWSIEFLSGFGSVTFYLVDPDHLDVDSPEMQYIMISQSRKFINNASDKRIPELGRHIVKTVQFDKVTFCIFMDFLYI